METAHLRTINQRIVLCCPARQRSSTPFRWPKDSDRIGRPNWSILRQANACDRPASLPMPDGPAPSRSRKSAREKPVIVGSKAIGGVAQVVPFLRVSDIERSLRFYTDGLGFTMAMHCIDGGKLRWCRLEKGGAAIMLQEIWRKGDRTGRPEG